MTNQPYLLAVLLASVLTVVVYSAVGWRPILGCLRMWTRRDYWTSYNTVEFLAWGAKAGVIVPGLVFGLEIWWLHLATLGTSIALIWASMRKLLPTLVMFNTLWIFLSTTVLVRHFAGA
ncbi:hypothetical protein [Parvularcula oceani]|uniref:hypothetical protein n=1 Tax=Parvularcula oceani TaxID=1247963 RepID=UPI0004E28CDA|nr:hypothetical protein [Parvularcula oceani]